MQRIPRRVATAAAAFATVGLVVAGCGDENDTTSETVYNSETSAAEAAQSAAESAAENARSGAEGAAESAESAAESAGNEIAGDATTVVPGPDGQEYEISGAVLDKYNETGGASGPLGPPTGSQESVGDGSVGEFQGGVIAWSPDTGAYVVGGEIQVAWEAVGGAGGDLGFPISDEHPIEGGVQSDFEMGHITFIDGRTQVVND
ncbi:LGFP repeat-containing protein [Rhodococcus phenolicus]|uniref:LGFP repeat-containing protein n=1 Tax=Rhodococcus phenolicus TaxID=263849 RepID=UPI00083266FD|nr:esterase [Rhodococcus phenolicus]